MNQNQIAVLEEYLKRKEKIMKDIDIERVSDMHHAPTGVGGFTRHYLTLYTIIYGMEAKNVFEFGMGFSTQAMVEALKSTGGKLTTCDARGKGAFYPEAVFKDAPGNWTFHQGDTLQVVPMLDHSPYDVVLHDGSHQRGQVAADLTNILPHIKKGGLLLVHDTNHHDLGAGMRGGIDDSSLKDYKHERLTLPYSYGLTIIKLLSSKTNEEVKIDWRPK